MQCACSVNKPSWHSTDVVLSTTVNQDCAPHLVENNKHPSSIMGICLRESPTFIMSITDTVRKNIDDQWNETYREHLHFKRRVV